MTTILFDIDGTLLRSGGHGGRSMGLAMEEVWGLSDPLRDVSFVGGTDSGVAELVAPGRDPWPMWERYIEILTDVLVECDPLVGVVSLLEALAGADVRVGLLTGNIVEGARAKLGAAGLVGHFDFAISGFAEHGVLREEIAAHTRGLNGDGPIVVVGDTPADIQCARHIGARVLTVGTGYSPADQLQSADRFVEDLSETDAITSWLRRAV